MDFCHFQDVDIVIKMTGFGLFRYWPHVSSGVLSHTVMCWELKNGVKDVTSANLLDARHHKAFSLKVKSLRDQETDTVKTALPAYWPSC